MSVKKGLEIIKIANQHQISFQTYGVKIGVRTELHDLLSEIINELDKITPNSFEIIEDYQVEHLYEVKPLSNKSFDVLKDGKILTHWAKEESLLPYLKREIRLTIAEFAESKVFLHAGAVGWKGGAILIPGRSFSGKTSLVAELVKKGAFYYSDDFAVLDQNGLLHPFHRQLSLRGIKDPLTQVDFPVEALGGRSDSVPLNVGIILVTEFQEGFSNPQKWKPEILSSGQGIMEIIAHTIPIRYNPEFSLNVLNKIARRAIICKSPRGDAEEFADLLLDFFENKVIK